VQETGCQAAVRRPLARPAPGPYRARMPELPEVETVRRMLEATVRGRTIRAVALSGLKLREPVPPGLPRRLRGRTIRRLGRTGKYLLIGLDGGLTLLSHLGMSGRWLVPRRAGEPEPAHVHVRVTFTDGTRLWYEDARRFGLLRLVPDRALASDPALARLGPDPLAEPPTGRSLAAEAAGSRVAVKTFLLDQRHIAGLGNIYASEVLHRSRVDPRRRAGSLSPADWSRVAGAIRRVLPEAIARMGTTFSTYRTIWDEPGQYGAMLRVYDRAGEPCRRCGTPIRRLVQAGRSTYFCPACQARRRG
jgi:formamidopyrimidine-DNA glycosylase